MDPDPAASPKLPSRAHRPMPTPRAASGVAAVAGPTDGTWDMLLRVIQSEADAAGRIDWSVSRAIRAHLRARGIGSVIPNPTTRRPTASAAAHAAD